MNFYPANDLEWEKYYKTKLQLKVKDDIDGKYITFRRPTKKLIGEELVIFSPPEITGEVNVTYVDPEGNRVRQYNKSDKILVQRKGEPVNIGNGSLVLLNFSYYETVKGAGHRMEGIKVLELVEYNPEGPDTSKTEKEAPVKESPTPVKDEPKTDKTELNDEIPW